MRYKNGNEAALGGVEMFRLMQPKMPPRVDASLPISTVGALHSGKRHHALLVVKLASLSSCLLSFSLAVMWYRHFSPGPWCLSLQPRSTAHVLLRSILALASYVHFLFVIHSLKSLVEIYKTLIQAFNLYEICILITLKHVSIPHTLNVVTALPLPRALDFYSYTARWWQKWS